MQACNNNTYARSHISKDMQGCGFGIQILLFFVQSKTNVEVDGNPNGCRREHEQRLNWFGMLEALHRLVENPDGHENERDCIDKGRQDAYTMIAKGFAGISGSFRLCCGKPGEVQCKDIGQRMSCIGEECQRMGQQTTSDLSGHNDEGEEKGETQCLLRHSMCMIVSGMFTAHRASPSSCRQVSSGV